MRSIGEGFQISEMTVSGGALQSRSWATHRGVRARLHLLLTDTSLSRACLAPQYGNQQSRMGVALNGSHYWDPNRWTSITAWVTKLRNDFFFPTYRSDGAAHIRRCFTDLGNGGLQIWPSWMKMISPHIWMKQKSPEFLCRVNELAKWWQKVHFVPQSHCL